MCRGRCGRCNYGTPAHRRKLCPTDRVQFTCCCVVQFGFAATAVDYLHRIGRTARAGHPGRAVSVYMPQDDALVEGFGREEGRR